MTSGYLDREELMHRMEELRELIERGEYEFQIISDAEREAALHNLEMDIKRLEEAGE